LAASPKTSPGVAGKQMGITNSLGSSMAVTARRGSLTSAMSSLWSDGE
jgi:hypothetical protein